LIGSRIVTRLYRGDRALARVEDERFQREWLALADACPFGTCFQRPPFVRAWYRCYESLFEPVLVEARDEAAALIGLLCLACERRRDTLLVAGRDHAEYHSWLARPEHSSAFFEAALDALAETWPSGHLQFLFAPPGLPALSAPRWRNRTIRRAMVRPLMATGPEAPLAESMRKSANRSRLNRLKKLGALSCDRIVDPDELDAVLEEVIPFYECRQGAAHAALPFRTDPLRRRFLLAAMAQPGLLHVTALRLDGRTIAAHIGYRNGGHVVLGIIAHSPAYARFSAGKLLLRTLGLRLQEEGFTHLDLTPGGEYKDRFASEHDEASVLDVWFSHAAVRAYKLQRAAIDAGKRFVSTDHVKDQIAILRHKARLVRTVGLPGTLSHLGELATGRPASTQADGIDAAADAAVPPIVFNRDALADLTAYDPVELWQPPMPAFLRDAMARLERGEHVYTCVRDGRLAAFGWLAESSAVPYDCYTHPRYRRLGLHHAMVRQVMAEAAAHAV
jgi:CelD/BcsL family acetyltransferase involved in cellulose biosynthesis